MFMFYSNTVVEIKNVVHVIDDVKLNQKYKSYD